MKLPFCFALVLALGIPAASAYGQSTALVSDSFASSSSFSSSNSIESVPSAAAAPAEARHFAAAQSEAPQASGARPFRSFGFEAKVGTGGIGFDVATPLNRVLNLRAGAQFFDHTANILTDGITAAGDITLQNVEVSVDYFPFRHSSFHISPGVTLHNDNHVAGPLNVAGGQTFSLGDQDYTSDPTDPLQGFARVRFGNTVAPRFTAGFGNLVPRGPRRLSFPFEFGFQYTSDPTLTLSLGGSGCDADGCGPINSGDGPQNLQTEIQELESDIRPLRFFPIVAFGVSYKFGH